MARLGIEVEALPRCREPGHEYFRVWRDGFKGEPPARRQRFRCVEPGNRKNWHRFTLPVLRVAAHDDRCLGCQQHVPSHAGPVVAEGYHYLSKVVAGALAEVARGATYSAASASARAALAYAGGEDIDAREFSTHGQLAADWTEVFTDVVVRREQRWPGVVLLDSTDFWRRAGEGRKQTAFVLLVAYGYDVWEGPHPAPDDPWQVREPSRTMNGRVLRVMLALNRRQPSWEALLRSMPGVPYAVVADGEGAIRNAVVSVWGEEAAFVRCVYHLRENLATQLASDLVRATGHRSADREVQEHDLMVEARGATRSVADWDAFVAKVRTELPHQSLTNGWLVEREVEIRDQLARADERPGPQSVGPLEQVIHQLRKSLGRRVQGLDNPARTQLLLDLLTAGLNTQANADLWAERIYEHLLDHQRRPARKQREIAGLSLRPSRPPIVDAEDLDFGDDAEDQLDS
jgi:hypothetical protein